MDTDLDLTSAATSEQRRIRVALIFGGSSSEHAVSCATAASVIESMDPQRYEIVPIGITHDGRWVLTSTDPGPLRLSATHTPAVDPQAPPLTWPSEPGTGALGSVDVAFPLLHGPFGEDGTIQGLLELAQVRYVGSGVTASAVMMDKAIMKLLFAAHGLPIGPYAVITDSQWCRDRDAALERVRELEFPLFVKPARAGSSMGISKVSRLDELIDAIEAARAHDGKVIVEQGIAGREIECGVLQGHGFEGPRASPPGECTVVQGHDFYDYEAKYLAVDDVRLDTPADLAPDLAARVRQLAVQAFEAAGCEGLARVDFFVTSSDEVVLNEINTMPGFTPQSMFPRMWASAGVSYPELIDELISLALERPLGLR